MEAGQDLDQRRLAGPVVADQAEHLAGSDIEGDVLERCHHPEALTDVLDPDRVGFRAGCRQGRQSRSLISRAPVARTG